MPKFNVTTTARATIRQYWSVEAPDEAAVREVLCEGGFRDDVELTSLRDETLGDEEGREITSLEAA